LGPQAEALPVAEAEVVPPAPSSLRTGAQTLPRKDGPVVRRSGFELVVPYPLDNLMRGFKGCRKGKRVHPAVDIGGVGPNGGLGTPVHSMVRARIERIGLPAEQPELYGTPDTRPGVARRSGRDLPRSLEISGYGTVHFFTLNYGRWRSGTTIVLSGLDGGMQGYRIRYMHLGAVRPDLRVGQIVEAGEEIGLMGCTAIMESPPHLHLEALSPEGVPLDLKALFTGKPLMTATCPVPASRKAKTASKKKVKKSNSKATKPDRSQGTQPGGPAPISGKARLQR
jgi:hypothetical protein